MTQAVLWIVQLQLKLKLFSWMSISSPSANRKCRLTPPSIWHLSKQPHVRFLTVLSLYIIVFLYFPEVSLIWRLPVRPLLTRKKIVKKKHSCLSLLIKGPHLKLCAVPLPSEEDLRFSRLQRVRQINLRVKATEILTASSECQKSRTSHPDAWVQCRYFLG